MKNKKLVVSMMISTIILSGAVCVLQVSAQERQTVETPGTIEFASNSDEDVTVIPPETEGPDVDIPVIVEPNTGPLTIVYAPTLDFGNQVISNSNQEYQLVAERHMLTNSDEDVPYTSFAQVSDTRGTNEGWNLSVSMTEFESNTQNNVLTGAQITFKNPSIRYEGSNTDNAPTAHNANIVLSAEGGSHVVMNASEGKGAGVSSVIWGNQAQLDADEENPDISVVLNPSIELSVPGSTVKDATTYEATLTWTLGNTPSGVIEPEQI